MARGGVAEQGGDIDLQGAGEAIERGQGRHGLAVLDLGDVGARDAHARGELPLREIADVAEIAHGGGDLKAVRRAAGCGDECEAGLGAGSGSSTSRDLWQRRHSAFAVRNCTSLQWSQRRTSRCSTGAIIVAIVVCMRADPEQGPQHTSDNGACDVPRVTLGDRRVKGYPGD